MRDPMCVAHELRYPWRKYRHPKNDFEKTYRESFATIWHNDPETDGTDDSCGWFLRARHLDKEVLARIISRFAFEWSHGVPFGWFSESEDPNFSVQAIVLDMFTLAAGEVFGFWSRKQQRYLRDHLHDILRFAENPCDSLYTSITSHYGKDEKREQRIRDMAGCVYSYIMRNSRPFWKHPKWHVHHWSLQVPAIQNFKRWAFTRCNKCGGHFRWGQSPVSDSWHSTGPQWFRSENVYHMDCSNARVSADACKAAE